MGGHLRPFQRRFRGGQGNNLVRGGLGTVAGHFQENIMLVKESHTRTITKTVIYRILCTIAVYCISLALGADSVTSGTMAIASVILGTIMYYAHDRIWNKFSWRRTDSGTESYLRSFVKTVTYRIIVIVVATILARLIITENNSVAFAFAVAQTIVNATLFYIVERIANRINAGRQIIID